MHQGAKKLTSCLNKYLFLKNYIEVYLKCAFTRLISKKNSKNVLTTIKKPTYNYRIQLSFFILYDKFKKWAWIFFLNSKIRILNSWNVSPNSIIYLSNVYFVHFSELLLVLCFICQQIEQDFFWLVILIESSQYITSY